MGGYFRSKPRTVRTTISLTYTDGETMYDDDYEVIAPVEWLEGGTGWSDTWALAGDIRFSAPGGDVDRSSAVMWALPSYAEETAADAILDQAEQDETNGGEQYYPEDDR